MGDFKVSVSTLRNQNIMLKRKRNLLTSDIRAKHLKNTGKIYQGRNGEHHPEKVFLQEQVCGPRCHNAGCRLPEERKVEIFTQFWATGSYDEQNGILARYFRREQRNNEIGEVNYFIPDNRGVQTRVCHSMFLSCFGISKKRLRVLQTKVNLGNISVADKRGRHHNHPRKLGDNVREAITNHINSYEKHCGHYSRQSGDPERAYLSKDLNVSIMFRDFAAAYGEDALHWEWIYRAVFRELKLRIGIPKTDTCTSCDRYHCQIQLLDENDNNNAVLLQEIWTNFIEHQLHSENGYNYLSSDINKSKADSTYITICVDLQSVLPCPRLTNGDFYYQRKFSCYNLAIFDGASENTSMCFWNQREASRGSSEIASCIFKYCMEKFHPLEEEEKRTLVVYSDRCTGQNNNFILLILYKLLIDRNFFTDINQKFMTTGHSFLPCDRQFALIEKKQKKAIIFEPAHWIKIIEDSSHNKPFMIQRMMQPEFKDFKSFSEKYKRPKTLKVTESMWFQLCKELPDVIKSKNLLSDVSWNSHLVRVKPEFANHLELLRLYQMPLMLPQGLIDDLKRMQDFIPQDCKVFWEFLQEM